MLNLKNLNTDILILKESLEDWGWEYTSENLAVAHKHHMKHKIIVFFYNISIQQNFYIPDFSVDPNKPDLSFSELWKPLVMKQPDLILTQPYLDLEYPDSEIGDIFLWSIPNHLYTGKPKTAWRILQKYNPKSKTKGSDGYRIETNVFPEFYQKNNHVWLKIKNIFYTSHTLNHLKSMISEHYRQQNFPKGPDSHIFDRIAEYQIFLTYSSVFRTF